LRSNSPSLKCSALQPSLARGRLARLRKQPLPLSFGQRYVSLDKLHVVARACGLIHLERTLVRGDRLPKKLPPRLTPGADALILERDSKNPMKKLAIVLLFPLLAACDADMEDEEMVLETDMSEANMSTDCPVDVSEADRANYPACN